jgi:hypothetical protein
MGQLLSMTRNAFSFEGRISSHVASKLGLIDGRREHEHTHARMPSRSVGARMRRPFFRATVQNSLPSPERDIRLVLLRRRHPFAQCCGIKLGGPAVRQRSRPCILWRHGVDVGDTACQPTKSARRIKSHPTVIKLNRCVLSLLETT